MSTVRLLFVWLLLSFGWAGTVAAEKLTLTAEEQAFVDAHPKLRFAVSNKDFIPYIFSDNQQSEGYLIDLLELLADRIGVELEIIASASDPEILEGMLTNRYDASLASATPGEAILVDLSDPVISLTAGLVMRGDHPLQFSLDQYSGRRIGVVRSPYLESLLLTRYPGIELISYPGNRELIQAVQFAEVDAGFSSLRVLNYIIQQHYLSGLHAAPVLETGLGSQVELHIAVRKQLSVLTELLNRALASLSSDQKTQLEQKWFATTRPPQQLQLTVEERALLNTLGPLHYCIDPDWSPYEWLEQGKHIGLSADFMALLNQKLNLDLQLLPTASWKQSLTAFTAGKCQMLPVVTPTASRHGEVIFSRPYLSTPMVVAMDARRPFIDDLETAGPLKLGIGRAFTFVELMKNRYPDIEFVSTENVTAGLARVQRGDLDGFVDSLAVINYTINQLGTEKIKIAARMEPRLGFSFAFPAELAPLAGLFNKAMNATPKIELDAIRQKWLTLPPAASSDYLLIGQVVAVASFFLLLAGVWNRKLACLNRNLDRKRAQLQQANVDLARAAITDPLTQTGNRKYLNDSLSEEIERARRYQRPLSLLMIDVDHFKSINDQLGHEAGDSVLVELASQLKNNIRQSDHIGRWGGEEFVVLLPEADRETGEILAEKLRRLVEIFPFSQAGKQTISIGGATLIHEELNDQLLRRADQALYQAKATGRNRVTWQP